MRRIGCLGSRRKGRFSKLRYGMGGSAAIAAYLNYGMQRIPAKRVSLTPALAIKKYLTDEPVKTPAFASTPR